MVVKYWEFPTVLILNSKSTLTEKKVWKAFYLQIKKEQKQKSIYSTIYNPVTKFTFMFYWTKFNMKIIFKQPRKSSYVELKKLTQRNCAFWILALMENVSFQKR